MLTKNKNGLGNTKKTLAVRIVLLGVIIVAASLTYYFFVMRPSSPSNKDGLASLNQQIAKQGVIDSGLNSSGDAKSGQQSAGTYTPPSSSDNIRIEAQRVDSNNVAILTRLYGYSDGTCKLTATNGSAQNTQTAAILFQSEYSLCQGFTVPVSTLGLGIWSIHLDVISGGITNNKQISFEVK